LARANKKDELDRLKKRVESALKRTAMGFTPVFGSGPVPCPVMLVGEAPGRTETELGLPFVGRAGVYLVKNLEEVFGRTRDELYITNVVKVWPHIKTKRLKTRPPTKKEEAFFLKYLLEEIEIVDPLVIVAVGKTAFTALAPGEVFRPNIWAEGPGGRQVMPVYHPAYILRKQKSISESTRALRAALRKVKKKSFPG
jgi:DNA polymerase